MPARRHILQSSQPLRRPPNLRQPRWIFAFAFLFVLSVGGVACQKSSAPDSPATTSKGARSSGTVSPSPAPTVAATSKAPADTSIALRGARHESSAGSRSPRRRSRPPGQVAPAAPSLNMQGSGSAGGGRGGEPGPAKGKAKEKKKEAKKSQVWQRSKSNTVLSKVSVGGKKYLVLKKMRVTVSVEGLRARTVIDHVYYNPHHRTLQGTFKYTLPTNASVSYYAMFIGRRRGRTPRFFGGKLTNRRRRQLMAMAPGQMLRRTKRPDWGKLREARLVAAEKGREVYEEITRQKIDPALLEQDAPNTFTGRVFPIPKNGYNRVIIAYEQTLPQLRNELVYRFRFPAQVADSIDFSIEYNNKFSTLTRTNLRKIRCKADQTVAFMRCYWEQNKPDRDAVFYFKPKHKHVNLVASADPVENRKYLYARARVQLPVGSKHFSASHGLFALDTSLSANPDLFAAHVALLGQILERNEKNMPHFNVLLFDTSAQWLGKGGWLPNTAASRKKALQTVRQIVLEGATNFNAALTALARPPGTTKPGTPVDIFVLSDGQLNWGDTQINGGIARFHKERKYGTTRFFAYQLGIGAENASFQQRLAREGGALFSCLGKAELPRCAVAHTRPAMLLEQVSIKGIGATEILVQGRQVSLYPGAMVGIAARFARSGVATILFRGQYLGKPITVSHKTKVVADGELAPRAWGELAVAQLSELNDDKLTDLIVAYSQHFRIPNKHCSFLVLETNKEYKQYGLNKARKEQRVKDVALFVDAWIKRYGVVQSPFERWATIIRKAMKQLKSKRSKRGRTKLSIVRLMQRIPSSSFVMSPTEPGALWLRKRVSAGYLRERLKDQNEFGPFVKEAKRRLRKDVGGAIRALSCIVELHPGNPQALRLVGYYLMAWQRPSEAAQIFLRVLARRSFEPHAYRDLARALVKMERFGLAAVFYEIASAGDWHRRFRSINTVLREEYAMLIYRAQSSKLASRQLKRELMRRGAFLGLRVKRSKLRVTMTWNTDNSDIDLWVDEPNGQRCSFRNRRTRNGGALLQDITRGYGPERYQNIGGMSGKYRVRLQFYGHRSNVLGNETHVSVVMIKNAGTRGQEIIEKNFVLKRNKQIVEVANLSL